MIIKIPEPNGERMWIKESEIKAIFDVKSGVKSRKQPELILFTDILVARFTYSLSLSSPALFHSLFILILS